MQNYGRFIDNDEILSESKFWNPEFYFQNECFQIEFHRIQAYLMGLKYQNTVDYTFISEMVHLAMRNNGVRMSEKFDWQED